MERIIMLSAAQLLACYWAYLDRGYFGIGGEWTVVVAYLFIKLWTSIEKEEGNEKYARGFE